MRDRRCLVVEDEDLLAELLADNLGDDGWLVDRAAAGDEAWDQLRVHSYDLIVLDVMLPGLDGFEILRRLRAGGDRSPVLVLSARNGDNDRIRGLELGADDYLGKPFQLQELLLRCRALLRRSRSAPWSREIRFGGNRIDLDGHRATTWRGEEVALTPAELALLELLAERAGQVVPREEIVARLFGPTTSPKHRTVDNLVLRLRRLLEPEGEPRYLETVRGVGLRLRRD